MFELDTYMAANNRRIEGQLGIYVPEPDPGDRLAQAMRYSLMAGGKRIRPNLCVAACEAVGGDVQTVIPAACALEMIHTYSLIHDDLPAMDDDDLRRGKPTCHRAFDEATAILAGDALLTLGFEVLCATTTDRPDRLLEAIRIIAGAAGFRGMVLGQMMDIQSEGSHLKRSQLEQLHGLKTGAMIEASLLCGALLGGGSRSQLAKLKIYGRAVGLAFQVVDDILNVEGDPALMGKASGTDTLRRKNAYPELLGLDKSKDYAHTLIERAVTALSAFDHSADPLRAIARYVVFRNK